MSQLSKMHPLLSGWAVLQDKLTLVDWKILDSRFCEIKKCDTQPESSVDAWELSMYINALGSTVSHGLGHDL